MILERIDGPKFDVSPFKRSSIRNVSMINGIVVVNRLDIKDGYIMKVNKFLNFSEDMKYSR